MHRGLSGGRRQQSGQSAGGRRQQSGQSAGGGSMGASPLGGLSRSFGGSFPLQSARLRLLRASAAAFRSSRRGFGCFGLRRQLSASVGAASAASGFVGRGSLQLLGLRLLSAPELARLRSAVGSSALLRPPPPSFASPSQSLRLSTPSSLPLSRAAPPSAASATASLRYKQPPPPSAASATASLRYKQPPPPLLKPPRGLAPMLPPPADCPDC